MVMRNPNTTIRKMIDKQKIVYISAIDATGFPTTKAMLAPRVMEGIRVFYLTTNTSSKHVDYYRKKPQASLYFCDQRFFRGVMLQGNMEVLEEQEYKEKLWQEGDTTYYAKGVTDPDYCVLRFTAKTGRYYSTFTSEDFEIIE